MSGSYSLVIRGGTVINGTGADPIQADVGISAGRIVDIAPNLARGETEIEAEGRLVTPGFVDIHTHYDGRAMWDSHLAQGYRI